MQYTYYYNTGAGGMDNPGDVEIRNVVIGFNRGAFTIVTEFDIRGKDWDVTNSDYVEAKLVFGDSVKATETIDITDTWQRRSVTWNTVVDCEDGTTLDMKDYEEQSIVLRIEDENNTTTDYTHTVDINLDPQERYYTLLSPPPVGETQTPNVEWRITDMPCEQNIKPVLYSGPNMETQQQFFTATYKNVPDGFTTSGTFSLLSGLCILNGQKFKESSLVLGSITASGAVWKDIDTIYMQANGFQEGDNHFKLELNSTAI